MAGLAGEGDRVALDAEAADHGRGGLARLLQARALLDVQLEVGGDVGQLGLAHRVEVDVVLLQRVRERDALVVLEVADRVGVERARGGGRAEQAAAEARALLVGPVDQLQRDRRRLALVAAQHLERGAAGRGSRRASRRAARRRCASRRRRSCRSRPGSSPTGSRRRRARRSRRSRPSLPSSHSRAVRQSSLHASRRAPSGPPVSSASSCRSLSGRSQSKSGMGGTIGATPVGVRGSSARMIRWRRIIGVSLVALFALHTGAADAASPYAQAVLVSCDQRPARGGLRGARGDASSGRAKMQLRFTLQGPTPDEPRWRKVDGAELRRVDHRAAVVRASTRTPRPSRTCCRRPTTGRS